jgi:hypothetical protein
MYKGILENYSLENIMRVNIIVIVILLLYLDTNK